MTIRVIIVGANGHLGRHLVSTFISDPHFVVSILTRQHSHSPPESFPTDVPVHTIPAYSYTSAVHTNLVQIFSGQDVLISAIASHATAQQNALIDAAIDAGVKHFIPSEFGFDSRSERAGELLPDFLCKGKREIVEYLELRRKQGARINWTAFVTGPFAETSVPSYMGFDLDTKQATLFRDIDTSRWSATTLGTAALAVKNALLLSPVRISSKYLFIESFNICQRDILESLDEVTGLKWGVAYCDAEETKKDAVQKLAKGDYSGFPNLMRYAICMPGFGADYTKYEVKANDMLGLPEERLNHVLAKFINDS